ncbi:ABC transporter permease subunit [Nonomuraea sp. NPDC049421]|uniref:ABC transporter permease n=1 Tax=Nonomuraea sp. NPDC049421 TaxID=3155275 RepID=UPI0034303F45
MTAAPAAGRRARARYARNVAGVAAFLLAWQALGMSGLVSWLPPAAGTLGRTAELAADPEFLAGLGGTLTAAALGLPLAVLIAVPAGLLLGTVPALEEMTRVFVEFLRPIPSVALIPLALFFIQPELNAEIALVAFAAAWPILINTLYGVRDADPLAKDTLRSFGFGRGAVVVWVLLPSAAPFVATGVRLAASVALILAISVEYVVGGSTGIGGFLIQASTGIGMDALTDVIAVLIWSGAIGLAANALLARAERRLFRWRQT